MYISKSTTPHFLERRKLGWSANCWHVDHLLSVCWLTKEDGDTSLPNLLKRCILHRVRSRYDWNSPTRCHTKTWYVRFWPKHVNLMILPSKMTALPGEIGRANVVFGCKWDQFRSQTSPLKWDVDTVYQRLHLRKTTHFPWFHDHIHTECSQHTRSWKSASHPSSCSARWPWSHRWKSSSASHWVGLHLRIDIAWLKQTCRCLWENIPLYIFSTLIILPGISCGSNGLWATQRNTSETTVSLKNDQVQGPRLQKLYLHHTSISSGYIDLWVITDESQQSALWSQDKLCEMWD